MMSIQDATHLFSLGFGFALSTLINRDYYGVANIGISVPLSGVFASEAAMYAALGNPPGDVYIGRVYAYLETDAITWQIVQVIA